MLLLLLGCWLIVVYCIPIPNPPPPTPINIIQLIAAWKWVAGGGFGDDLDHPLAVEFRLLPSEDNVQLWELLHWWKYVASWMILLMHYLAYFTHCIHWILDFSVNF